MTSAYLVFASLAALGLVSCGRAPAADLVFRNGLVVTVDKAHPRATAVAVAGSRILAVGTDSEIEKYIEAGKTRVIDLQGRMLTPGFNDAHAHIISVGSALEKVDLVGITSWDQMRGRVAARVGRSKPGEWIVGRGWDQSLIPDKAWPTKEIIDPVSPDNPVILSRSDSHSLLVNSFLLKLSGITRDTPDPEGGIIVRDPATGEPTGVLKEAAMGLVKREHPSHDQAAADNKRYLGLALAEARRLGVTSIQNFNGGEETFEEARRDGELTVRVYLGQALTADPEVIARYRGMRARYKDDPLIRFGALKAFIDGTLGSQTAAMFEPYNDNPSTSGTLVTPEAELDSLILAADRDSFQVAVHAIGSRGNRIVLDAFEKALQANGRRDSRHRIEHAQILTAQDIPRFAALGVIASMQPTHCITDKRFAEDRLGRERCRYAYAWNSILKARGRIAFGTDCPIEPLNPMEGLYAAVTRKDRRGEPGEGWFPEEKLTMEQALELYTLGSAYAEFQEKEKGSVEPGKLADLVVLSQNLFEIPEDRIMQTEVVYTVFDGKIVYEKK